jgi:uncharacterized iron-regulated protein
MILFIWLLLISLHMLFKIISLKNQSDGRRDAVCKKSGTKIGFFNFIARMLYALGNRHGDHPL